MKNPTIENFNDLYTYLKANAVPESYMWCQLAMEKYCKGRLAASLKLTDLTSN